jgi:hypothetical protein
MKTNKTYSAEKRMKIKIPEVNDRLGTSTLLCEVNKSHASGVQLNYRRYKNANKK